MGFFNYYFKVVLEVIDFIFPNQAYTQFLAFFHPVTFIMFFILCVLTLYMPHIPFCWYFFYIFSHLVQQYSFSSLIIHDAHICCALWCTYIMCVLFCKSYLFCYSSWFHYSIWSFVNSIWIFYNFNILILVTISHLFICYLL